MQDSGIKASEMQRREIKALRIGQNAAIVYGRLRMTRTGERLVQLSELGDRICVFGPSNSGKSTLAVAMARQRALPVVHLDLLYHQPGTDWRPRPTEEFLALHERAIAGERWVIEGNYSVCTPQRLQRATGVILLDISTLRSLFRYARRTLFERDRAGALEGARNGITWGMIHHIVAVTPGNRRRYAEMYRRIELPKVRLTSARAIDDGYREWKLVR